MPGIASPAFCEPQMGGLLQLPAAGEDWHSPCSTVPAGMSPGCRTALPDSRDRGGGMHHRDRTGLHYWATEIHLPWELQPRELSLLHVHKPLHPHVASEAWSLQRKQLPGWCGTKPRGFGWEQHKEGRRQIFLQHCGESLPRKWEVDLNLPLPEKMRLAVQSGQWLFTLCQSLLQHCSVFHLLASLSKMHVNRGLCEGFPPVGWVPVPV